MGPSASPLIPDPAIVDTTPEGVILRILTLPVSATYKFPDESIVIPVGLLKYAEDP